MTGSTLRLLRISLAWTQRDLALAISYSPDSIYSWEANRRRIPDHIAVQLQTVLMVRSSPQIAFPPVYKSRTKSAQVVISASA